MAYMSWRPLDLPSRQYYEDTDPQAAYRQYLGDMFGSQQNPLSAFANSYYSQARARYLKASEGDAGINTMWVDTLDNNDSAQGMAGGDTDEDLHRLIRREFYAQSAGNRGETAYYAPRGRITSSSW